MATYEIIIKNQSRSGGGGRSAVAGNKQSSGTAKKSSAGNDKKTDDNGASTAISTIAVMKVAKSFIVTEGSYYISTVSLKTGSSREQEKAQNAWQIAGDCLAVGGLIIGGIATANPLMIAAGIGKTATDVYQRINKQRTLDLETKMEQNTISRNNLRAGTGGSRSKWE